MIVSRIAHVWLIAENSLEMQIELIWSSTISRSTFAYVRTYVIVATCAQLCRKICITVNNHAPPSPNAPPAHMVADSRATGKEL